MLDDVLIFSKTREEHTRHVNEVIRRLGTAGLQIDINKSEFYTTKKVPWPDHIDGWYDNGP